MRNTKILDGRRVRGDLLSPLKQKISEIEKTLHLVVIQIGSCKENELYLKQKKQMADMLGVIIREVHFSESVTMSCLSSKIIELNHDSTVHGIIVQSPIPRHLSFLQVVECIDPIKDVDGLTSFYQQKLSTNPFLMPCTVRGILELLRFYQLSPKGKNIVVLGKSRLVGTPLASVLGRKNDVFLCDSKTENTLSKLKKADYIFIAIGKPLWLNRKMIKEGAIIVDIGTNLVQGKLIGDCDFLSVNGYASAISSVPGGVGPLTVISLFYNLLDLYLLQCHRLK